MECWIRLKVEGHNEMNKTFETGCVIKLPWRDRDKFHFEGGIRDKTATRDCDLVTCRT